MIVEASQIILPSHVDEMEIPIFADLHVGARACHEKRLENDLERVSRRPLAYPIFLGDQADAIVPKDPRRFTPSVVAPWAYDEAFLAGEEFPLEAVIDRQECRLVQILERGPTKRVLGIADGNHETQYLKHHSHDITRRVAKHFDWKMLGYTFFLTTTVGFQDHPRTFTFTIYGHHGWGGGSRTEGYNLTKYSRHMPYFDAQIFAFGHVHDTQTKIIPRLRPVAEEEWQLGKHADERICFDDRVLIVTGTYLRTLSHGRFPTYSEEKGYPPRKLGYASALLNFDVETGEVHVGYAIR